ncbi:MAG: GFA family protein [Pseudomonadota bacterium]
MSEESAFSAEGGCACGETRYRLTDRPLFVHCCHCHWCQRETGAAFALNALIETECVETLAASAVVIEVPSESGRGQKIHRCAACQVALWSHYSGTGETVAFIRVGTLDAPGMFPPDINIYTASKQPWVSINHEIPAVSAYYRRSEYWPEDSIERLRLAREHAAAG